MCCENSFYIKLGECPTSLKLFADLTANTEYLWVIRDKFGTEYSDYATTDGNGVMNIPLTLFPAGSFNRHSGIYTLEILESPPYYQEPINLIFCEDDYDSVMMDFVKTTLDSSIGYIKCEL